MEKQALGASEERDGEWGAGAAEKGMRMEILREEEPADHAPCRSFSGSVQVVTSCQPVVQYK